MKIVTYWFEIEGEQPIEAPPDISSQGDLQPGDLFYYRNIVNGKRSQIWIWIADEIMMEHIWKPVKIGYQRTDGRRLTLTEKRKNPSWIGEKWFVRRGLTSTSVMF